MMTPTLSELRKTATVRLAPGEAFELFTEHMAAWWPLATHSVGLEKATGVEFEPGVGGQIVETSLGGSTSIWGTVEVWEPPARLGFTWHPGTPVEEATRVEVRFHATGSGTTVELIHTGWDARPDGMEARAQYDPGWDFVFGRYAEAGDGGLTT
jgi:hypothetical protein